MTTLKFPSSLVSLNWLQDNLGATNLVILDASQPPIMAFTQVGIPLDAKARHLPHAMRFDYDKQVCDQNATLPHMMPTPDYFAEQVRTLGINNDSAVLIYDDTGVYASPRAWWMFKAMGHDNVAVLNGGSVAWFQAGLPMSNQLQLPPAQQGSFTANPRTDYFSDAIDVYKSLHDPACAILDARSEGRFNGTAPEPRENLRSGHMPGAKCVPFQKVLNDIYMKPVAELRQALGEFADSEQRVVTTCGSGLSACILTLAADLAGFDKLSVYDGSWCEWGQPGKLPVVTH